MELTEILFLIGRVIFGGYFLMSAWNHFSKHGMLTGYAASKGVPMPGVAVFVSGLLILFGGAGILFGVYVEWAVAAIAVFLVPVSFQMHNFWKDADPNMKMANMVNFTKNMALLGAALIFLSVPTPWILSAF